MVKSCPHKSSETSFLQPHQVMTSLEDIYQAQQSSLWSLHEHSCALAPGWTDAAQRCHMGNGEISHPNCFWDENCAT